MQTRLPSLCNACYQWNCPPSEKGGWPIMKNMVSYHRQSEIRDLIAMTKAVVRKRTRSRQYQQIRRKELVRKLKNKCKKPSKVLTLVNPWYDIWNQGLRLENSMICWKLKREDLMSLKYCHNQSRLRNSMMLLLRWLSVFFQVQEIRTTKIRIHLSNSIALYFVDDKLVRTVSRYWVCKETDGWNWELVFDMEHSMGKKVAIFEIKMMGRFKLLGLGIWFWQLGRNLGMMKLTRKLRITHIPKFVIIKDKYFDKY